MAALVMLSAAVFLGLLLPSSMADRNVLYGGETLNTGQSLTQGDYTFTMQSDCDLVLYDYGWPVWGSNTKGQGRNCYLSLKIDGILVIYDGSNKPVWKSDTSGSQGNFLLILQRDRNVVIYRVHRTWATGTNRLTANSEGVVIVKSDRNDTSFTPQVVVPAADEPTNRKIAMPYNILSGGEALITGQSLTQGDYAFTMQSDCNLVLFDNGRAVWASNTNGKGPNCILCMQTDGDLVIYDGRNRRVWASNTGGSRDNFILILQSDRNVVIYKVHPTWATGTNPHNSEGVVIVKSDRNDTSFTPQVVVPAADEPTNRKIAMVTNN